MTADDWQPIASGKRKRDGLDLFLIILFWMAVCLAVLSTVLLAVMLATTL